MLYTFKYATFVFDQMSTRFRAAVAETGSEDDGLLDLSDDDFFLAGSSSDEADADDEWTDKSARSVEGRCFTTLVIISTRISYIHCVHYL
ncbi:hypothetical protein VIGAN_08144600 [Vigna angularis var. angularis]|uniref:Uncharacterized protein n=1 Tax=Vigna angularis var. angularis TaxID=157739 RepID=A0A0S3SPM7_PHAAN|nr:hypothetical protein VIGAN_08144600 [Vigna angularis var. angularis]